MDTKKLIFAIIILIIIIIVLMILIKINNQNINSQEYDDIWYQNEAGVEYSDEQLDNFNFSIVGITEQVKNKISSEEQLNLEIKKYVYLNGLVQATKATLSNYKEEDNRLYLVFKLNNPEETKLTVSIDLEANSYQISEY